jgi:hypothetical protein
MAWRERGGLGRGAGVEPLRGGTAPPVVLTLYPTAIWLKKGDRAILGFSFVEMGLCRDGAKNAGVRRGSKRGYHQIERFRSVCLQVPQLTVLLWVVARVVVAIVQEKSCLQILLVFQLI